MNLLRTATVALLLGLGAGTSCVQPALQDRSEEYRAGWRLGVAEAKSEIVEGKMTVYTFGFGARSGPIHGPTGLPYRAIASCVVDEFTYGRRDGHDSLVYAELGLPWSPYQDMVFDDFGEAPTATDLQDDDTWTTEVEKFLRSRRVPRQAFTRIWEVLPIRHIRLVRGRPSVESDGFHPEYEIILQCADATTAELLGNERLGLITYTGTADVQMIGTYESALSLSEFARLALLAEAVDLYADMKTYPETHDPHEPHTFLEIEMKDGTRHVHSEWRWSSPVTVWAFTSTIDRIWADRLNENR